MVDAPQHQNSSPLELRAIIEQDILFLEEFQTLLRDWYNSRSNDQVRQAINRSVKRAQALVKKAGCAKVWTIAPPPVIGGPIVRVAPLESIFAEFWGVSPIPYALDMLDETIGAMRSPEYFQRLTKQVDVPVGSANSLEIHASALVRVLHVCSRFALAARAMRERHDGRATLDVNDEYDVQDLMRAMLKLDFDDVRVEEWTPSYAGKSSRVDFLLKSEEIVVEIKKTRHGLGKKEVGDQLLVDIGRYHSHPSCRALVCFVYDPELRIGNPAELENDLTRVHDRVDVRVAICPKGH